MFLSLHRCNNIVICKKNKPAPPICKSFNKNYVEFYFSLGTVLVIFSFFLNG